MHTQNKLHQSTRHIDDRSKEVLRGREHGLDAVEEGLDDGAEDVEDGLEEGGDGVCDGGHGCGSVLIVALLEESYVRRRLERVSGVYLGFLGAAVGAWRSEM